MGYDSHIYFTVLNNNDITDDIITKIVNEYKQFKYSFTEHGYDDWREIEYGSISVSGELSKGKTYGKVHINETRTLEVEINEWFPIGVDDRGSLACGVSDCFIEGFSQFSKLFPNITFRMYITYWCNVCLSVYDFTNGVNTELFYVSNEDFEFEVKHPTYDFLKERDDLFDYIDEQCDAYYEKYGEDRSDDDDIDHTINVSMYMTDDSIDISEFLRE